MPQCSTCHQPIPAQCISAAHTLAYCKTCDAMVPCDGIDPVPNRPVSTRIQDIRMADGSLALLFPTDRKLGFFLLLFGITWDSAVIALLTHDQFLLGSSLHDILFFALFLLVGTICALIGLSTLAASHALLANRATIRHVTRRFGRESITEVPNDGAVAIRKTERYKMNGRPIYGVAVERDGESMVIGHHLTDDEIGWIAHLIRAQAGPAQADGG